MRLLGEWLDEQQNRFTLGLLAPTGQLRFDIDLADRGKPMTALVDARQIASFCDGLRRRRNQALNGQDGAGLSLQPTPESEFSFELRGPRGAAIVAGRLLYAIADHMVTVIEGALSTGSSESQARRGIGERRARARHHDPR